MIRKILTIVSLSGLLGACQFLPGEGAGGGAGNAGDAATDDALDISVLLDTEVVAVETDAERAQRRYIADILFEGLQALDADRLLTPVDNNAYSRFQRALAFDPDNAIALQGLQDIAARYLQLSLQASRRGLFAEASTMLENARLVSPDHPELAAVWVALQAEMNSGDLFFDLDSTEVTRRSESVRAKLVDIARQAQALSANFLITSPNDDNARWMFTVMREAVEGHRLRGNIELASRTSVRLRLPRSE